MNFRSVRQKMRRELENVTSSFRAVLGLKNQKIRELEEQITRLKSEQQEGATTAIADKLQGMQMKLENVERLLNTHPENNYGELTPILDNMQRLLNEKSSNESGTRSIRITLLFHN
ncbi:hypothetical protein PMAYCL1PPCAC_25045 [Pristionchus mayeri]|uniref:Uncharacterized protein n=1 Tax=Pristionchus mayeri TaxID=1317129 RepID=A0AAN5D311_9BILA|nr:hypothetical protein PMAYCL1PPCAC_25045 [Pristionchus mayeri]